MSNSGPDNNDQTTSQTTYEVGYAKPPKGTQFKKGQSGNPRGRPKGSKNFSTILLEEANAYIRITENGKPRTITKAQAAVKQLMNKAASGDMRAIMMLSQLMQGLEEKDSAGHGSGYQLKPEDLAIMQSFSDIFAGVTDDRTTPSAD